MNDQYNVNKFAQMISGKPYADQMAHAKRLISTEDVITQNAGILEAYYEKYRKSAHNAPNQCIYTLQQELGAKFVELMERNK